MSEHLLHDFRYSSLVIRGEDDLQFFSAVHRIHLESKNVESFVLGQLEASELRNRYIGDDSAEVVQVSGVLARGKCMRLEPAGTHAKITFAIFEHFLGSFDFI